MSIIEQNLYKSLNQKKLFETNPVIAVAVSGGPDSLALVFLLKNWIRENKGNIINFSTIAVPLGLKGESIYVASKSGVEGFTKTFAKEVADFNIKVNCIAPGPIKTDLLKGVTSRQIKKVIKKQIFNKQYTKDTICDVVEILLDKKTDSITGQIVNVGGVQ